MVRIRSLGGRRTFIIGGAAVGQRFRLQRRAVAVQPGDRVGLELKGNFNDQIVVGNHEGHIAGVPVDYVRTDPLFLVFPFAGLLIEGNAVELVALVRRQLQGIRRGIARRAGHFARAVAVRNDGERMVLRNEEEAAFVEAIPIRITRRTEIDHCLAGVAVVNRIIISAGVPSVLIGACSLHDLQLVVNGKINGQHVFVGICRRIQGEAVGFVQLPVRKRADQIIGDDVHRLRIGVGLAVIGRRGGVNHLEAVVLRAGNDRVNSLREAALAGGQGDRRGAVIIAPAPARSRIHLSGLRKLRGVGGVLGRGSDGRRPAGEGIGVVRVGGLGGIRVGRRRIILVLLSGCIPVNDPGDGDHRTFGKNHFRFGRCFTIRVFLVADIVGARGEVIDRRAGDVRVAFRSLGACRLAVLHSGRNAGDLAVPLALVSLRNSGQSGGRSLSCLGDGHGHAGGTVSVVVFIADNLIPHRVASDIGTGGDGRAVSAVLRQAVLHRAKAGAARSDESLGLTGVGQRIRRRRGDSRSRLDDVEGQFLGSGIAAALFRGHGHGSGSDIRILAPGNGVMRVRFKNGCVVLYDRVGLDLAAGIGFVGNSLKGAIIKRL